MFSSLLFAYAIGKADADRRARSSCGILTDRGVEIGDLSRVKMVARNLAAEQSGDFAVTSPGVV